MFNGQREGVIIRIPLPPNLRSFWLRLRFAVEPILYFLLFVYDMFMFCMLYRFKCLCWYFFIRAIRKQVTSIPVPQEIGEEEAEHLMYIDL